jgi:DNA processing protein
MAIPARQLAPSEFPTLLKEITDPPETLYIKGALPDEEARFLCVVGSRKATAYGRSSCSALIEALAGYPVVIVSGLALGIDAEAHRAALRAGLSTLAVPGSGLGERVLYPRSNYGLAQEILKHGGALISEFPDDHKARPENFPQRNRIMAGLSHAVLIIEAELRSGTLITARLATEYNREVLAVEGPIFSPTSEGTHLLIKTGATPVHSADDILEVFNIQPDDTQELNLDTLSPDEQKIAMLLSETPLAREELARALKMKIQDLSVALSTLDLKGVIKEEMGVVRLAQIMGI